jgi:two-component system, response regulator
MMNDKYLLLAEDNANDVILTIKALEKCGVSNKLVVVSDGREAVQHLFSAELREKPAVVLLDLKLPFMDGMDILKQIRVHEETRHVPVIIMSASIDEKDRHACLLLGADEFHCKPVSFDDFVQLIRHICQKWLWP